MLNFCMCINIIVIFVKQEFHNIITLFLKFELHIEEKKNVKFNKNFISITKYDCTITFDIK